METAYNHSWGTLFLQKHFVLSTCGFKKKNVVKYSISLYVYHLSIIYQAIGLQDLEGQIGIWFVCYTDFFKNHRHFWSSSDICNTYFIAFNLKNQYYLQRLNYIFNLIEDSLEMFWAFRFEKCFILGLFSLCFEALTEPNCYIIIVIAKFSSKL